MRARPSGSRWVNSGAMTRKCRCAGANTRPDRPKCAGNPVGARSTADLAHRPVGPHEVDATDVVTGPLVAHGVFDRRGEAVVEVGLVESATGAQHRAEICVIEREQTGAELSFCVDAHTITVLAERLGDARDH